MGNLSENIPNAIADGPFGSNLKKDHYTDKAEVRIIQLSNIGEFGWKDDNKRYTTYNHLKEISRSEVQPEDIVIAKMMPAGRAIIVPNLGTKFVLSSDCIKFVPYHSLNKSMILHFINSNIFKEQVFKEVQGSTRQRTSLTKLKSYLLPLPSLPEQQRIVSKIEELFAELDKIDKAQEIYDNAANKLREKVLDTAMRGKLVPQDPNDEPANELLKRIENEKQRLIKGKVIKKQKNEESRSLKSNIEVPSGWITTTLQEIAYIQNGKSLKSIADKGNDLCLYCKVSDMNMPNNHMYILQTNEVIQSSKDKYAIRMPAIIFPKVGGALTTNKRRIIKSDNITGAVIPINSAIFKWLFLWFYQLDMNKISSGSVVPKVGNKELYPLTVPFPPLSEQQRIVSKIEEILPLLKV